MPSMYSRLDSQKSLSLPDDLQQRLRSAGYRDRHAAIQQELLDPERRRPADDRPLLITFVHDRGVVTIPSPSDDGQCLPAFDSPVQAADYQRTLLADGPSTKFLASSPEQFVRMLSDLRSAGVTAFTIDRCPRCKIFTCVGSASIKTASDVVKARAIFKATQLAMTDLYSDYALEAARTGRLETARDVSLEAVAHITLEDPRHHFLLGELAIALRDPTLLNESKAFLQFLEQSEWEQRLAADERAGTPFFAAPR